MSTLVEITGGRVYLEIALAILCLVGVAICFVAMRILYKQQKYKETCSYFFVTIVWVIYATFIIGRIFGQLSMIN